MTLLHNNAKRTASAVQKARQITWIRKKALKFLDLDWNIKEKMLQYIVTFEQNSPLHCEKIDGLPNSQNYTE